MFLSSIVCKICEKVIKKQWTEYLEREGIISETIWIQNRMVMCHQFARLCVLIYVFAEMKVGCIANKEAKKYSLTF